ncbi:T9SS type A sorting domain-containing protein [Olleya aquimaris]|uniref:Putative secreted protein (Por secretion system target) n=1 Tax=Olleya aquimaris TaxID=639310 RepID=A0A327RF16_9FLAO|nr:T9SS type A sorting domain-containing protein [Olleya aquimaris]RAJ14522.1 putative secreted protein (Por secretion system target) [Olleya aquimaris]
MKKITFLLLTIFAFIFNAQAQNTCATAVTAIIGTNTVTTIDGAAPTDICGSPNGTGQTAGEWFVFTPASDGAVTLSTNLPANDGITNSNDTRVIIYDGTCSALTCVAENDDISGANYLSEVTFSATGGTTYYIVFDDRWSNLGFDFTIAFESCSSAINFSITDFTTTTCDTAWDNTGNFEIEYGLYPYTQGSGGTSLTLTGVNNYQFTSLSPGKSYNVFIRQDCGGSFSTWEEHFIGTSPDTVNTFPFSENLEPDADQALLLNLGLSFAGSGSWSFIIDDTTDGDTTNDYAFDGTASIFSNNTFTNSDADAIVFIGPFTLNTSNQYTFSFQQRNFAASSPTRPNKDIELLAAPTNDGTGTTVIATFDDMDNTTYQLRSGTFTPSTTGDYYFGIRDKSSFLATATAANIVFADALSVSSMTLSTDEFNANSISHFYNSDLNTLNLESSSKPLTSIEIYSALGQDVLNKTLNSQTANIDVSNFSDGIYLAKVYVNGQSKTIKFVKH